MNTKRFSMGAIAVAMVLTGGCAASSGEEEAATDLPTLQNEATAETEDDTGEASESEGADQSEDVDPEIAMAEYEQCLSDQGIDLDIASGGEGAVVQEFEIDEDAGGDDPGSVALEDFEAATAECDQILEDAFGEFEMTPEQEAEMADQMLELERCLADQGFEIDMSGNSFELDENIDFEEFEAAMSECEPDGQFSSAGVGP